MLHEIVLHFAEGKRESLNAAWHFTPETRSATEALHPTSV